MIKIYVSMMTKLFFISILLLSNFAQSQITTWSGTWNNGIPDNTKDAVFTTNYTSAGNMNAKSVLVSNGAQVTISSNHDFTVQNNIDVSGVGSKLVFENNASLIQINSAATNTGNINYKRNATPMRQYEYTYWASPVSGQTLGAFSPLTNSNRFYTFNGNPTVNNYVVENTANAMSSSIGYVIMAPSNYTGTSQIYNAEFIGTPNNGNYSTPVFAYDNTIKNYNLIGNPYPSAISTASFFAGNSNLGALYFWTHNTAISNNIFSTTDYAIRTQTVSTAANSGGVAPGNYIAAGQGFFASSGTNGFINFNNSMRVASFNTQFFRNNQPSQAIPLNYYFWLNMTNTDGVFKQMALGYQENATNGYDFGIDASAAAGTYINFYSLISTNPFAIQGRAYPWNINDVIPLGYSSTLAGNFDIAIDHNDTFFDGKDIFLKDLVTQTFHNLKNGPYNFTTTVGTGFNSRFEIHYINGSLSNNDFYLNPNSVFVNQHGNEIEINSTLQKIKSIQVYNLLGQVIFEQKSNSLNKIVISNMIKQNQALIIKTELDNGQIISKKIVF